MSAKEVDRLHWMRLLAEYRTTQRQAAEALGLTARHLRRLYAAFRAAGAPGLVSKRRGKRSNRATPDAMRDQVVAIVRTPYADFGPTLACEKLVEPNEYQCQPAQVDGRGRAADTAESRTADHSGAGLGPDGAC